MADEPGITEPAAPAEPAAAGEPTPALVNAEGALRENWRESLPEDIRSDTVFDRVKDFHGMAKSLASAERMIGKDKIAIPNENSSEAELDAWHRAGGRPDTVEGYDWTKPDDFPEDLYSEDYAKTMLDILFANGGSKKLADALLAGNLELAAAQAKSNEVNAGLDMESLNNNLLNKWGNAYEQKKHLGDVAIHHGTLDNTELKERILEKFANDPDFIEYSSNLGAKFQESTGVHVPIETGPSLGDIDGEIAKLQASDAFTNRRNPDHRRTIEKVIELFKKKNVGKPAKTQQGVTS